MERLNAILCQTLDPTLCEYGFATVHGLLPESHARYTHALSLLRRFGDSIVDGILDGPAREYYEQYLAVCPQGRERSHPS